MSQKTKVKRVRAESRRRTALKRQRQRRLLLLGAFVVAFGAAIGATILITGGGSEAPTGSPAAPARPLVGQKIPILGQQHVPVGTNVDYTSNPPTSGDHWPKPAPWGVYGSPLPDEELVHNLEHGGIWISYTGIDAATRRRLEALARKYQQAVILTPRPQNDAKIAVASWGRLMELSSYDEGRIVAFISANINNSTEPLASVAEAAVKVGGLFPDFRVTDVDGRIVTRDSLGGKPSIIWFTTSYCVPCQIGARVVAGLDDELGGNAFNVLVLFVDPGESSADLVSWRDQFANPDWIVAFDPNLTLAKEVQLRFLDTKILLDENGIITNIDVNIADQGYLALLRQAVGKAR